VRQIVDLRTASTTIKDQGRRGTCVACAATVAHELVLSEGVELSIEFLQWAAKRHDGLPSTAEGTTLQAARTALYQDGQPPEYFWPYEESRDQLAPDYAPSLEAVNEAKLRVLPGGAEICPAAVDLRNVLDVGQPIVLGLRIHHTWHSVGQDGKITTPPNGTRDLGGHAVVVLGYRDDEFIFQNSWGEDWGDGGIGYLRSDYVDVYGIAAWAISP
jgi:Papain family cysteine protease